MIYRLCMDSCHDEPCTLPCPGCDCACDETQVVTVELVDGLLVPSHPHDPAMFVDTCPACRWAEQGSLNDGSLKRVLDDNSARGRREEKEVSQ